VCFLFAPGLDVSTTSKRTAQAVGRRGTCFLLLLWIGITPISPELVDLANAQKEHSGELGFTFHCCER
jgi:hypothetical protein